MVKGPIISPGAQPRQLLHRAAANASAAPGSSRGRSGAPVFEDEIPMENPLEQLINDG